LFVKLIKTQIEEMKKIFSLITLCALVATAAFAQPTKEEVKATPQLSEIKPAFDRPAKKVTVPGAPVLEVAEEVQEVEIAEGPKMTFEQTTVDYGDIEQNSDPLRTFQFVNDGSEPLIIKHAKGSCGCTVPKYPKEPIMPGESAVIEVRYDTKRIGPFNKSIRLTTNVKEQPLMLYIKGKVSKAPAGLPAAPSNLNGF